MRLFGRLVFECLRLFDRSTPPPLMTNKSNLENQWDKVKKLFCIQLRFVNKICEKEFSMGMAKAHSLSLLLPLLLALLLALDDEDELPLPLLLLFFQQSKNYITTCELKTGKILKILFVARLVLNLNWYR